MGLGRTRCMATKSSLRTPWTARLANLAPRSAYLAECPRAGQFESEMVLEMESPEGAPYEVPVTVFAEWEPAQRGGWDDPSWDAYFHSPVAYYFREGRGWKEITGDRVEDQVIAHFERG